MSTCRVHFAGLACASLLLPLAPSRAARADETQGWQWAVAPCVLLPSLSGDTSLPDRVPPIDASAGDVLDALELAALVRWGGTSEKWRFLGDAVYVGLGKRTKGDRADLDFDTFLLELAGAYRPNEHVDVLFGARYWSMGVEVDFDDLTALDVDVDRDWVDPFVGVRLLAPLGASWDFVARGDVGGFGVGSDLSWNGERMSGWNATEHFSLVLGYRHLTIEDTWHARVEDVDIDLALSGPEIGFAFRF